MPSLNLITNVKIPNARDFALEFSNISAKILEKPVAYISVIVTYNETLTFGDTFEPAINLRIDSLDNINPQVNEKYSKEFFEFFQKSLGVPANRGYILFNDPGRANIGHDGTTFTTIFGGK